MKIYKNKMKKTYGFSLNTKLNILFKENSLNG